VFEHLLQPDCSMRFYLPSNMKSVLTATQHSNHSIVLKYVMRDGVDPKMTCLQGGNLSGLPPSLQVLGGIIVVSTLFSQGITILQPKTCREGGSPLKLPPCSTLCLTTPLYTVICLIECLQRLFNSGG